MDDNDIVYNEVYEILNSMEQIYINLIDKDYLDFIKSSRISDKKVIIDFSKPLSEQNIHQKTFDILADINLTYWASDEISKPILTDKYIENDGDANV